MKFPFASLIAALSLAGCTTQPMSNTESASSDSSGSVRYECYTYVGSKHVLTLPIAPMNSEIGIVNVIFHGDQLEAVYTRSGLTQIWFFEDKLYLELDPDLTAAYYDFRGAEEGETRKPESVFECKKRRR